MLIINKKGKKYQVSFMSSWVWVRILDKPFFLSFFLLFAVVVFALFFIFFLPWLLFALCRTAGPYLSFRRFCDTRIFSYYCFLSFVVVSICFILLFFFRMTKMSLPAPGPEIVGKADRKKCAKNARWQVI